jgi:hypothetical protein
MADNPATAPACWRSAVEEAQGGEEGNLRLVARHRFRVVRLLPVRHAGALLRGALLPAGQRDRGAAVRLRDLCRGLPGAPFGAIVFGRIGDLVGRKYTFLVTILFMGGATFLVGLLPTFETHRLGGPVLLVTLRLVQGLALGGEYGGAATYVAEHAPHGSAATTRLDPDHGDAGLLPRAGGDRRCRVWHGRQGVRRLGLARAVLALARPAGLLGLHPAQAARVAGVPEDEVRGQGSKSPLTDSFLRYPNNKYVLLALLGRDRGPGRGVVHGQFYALFFLTITLKLDYLTAYMLIGASLLLGTPFFIFFGWLSDKIGRLKIILAGCLIAALTYFPLFQASRTT